jgi:hypothetical protein
LEEGLESIFFIDADMVFSPDDVVKLLSRPEPLIAGCYPNKQLGENAQLNMNFLPGMDQIKMGEWATDLVPVQHVGAGFMRIKCSLLQRLIDELELPRCRLGQSWGWPFFMPMIIDHEEGKRYLCEDYAFCHRCNLIGVNPLVDPSFRLWHVGGYPYGWEEAGHQFIKRARNLTVDVKMKRAKDPKGGCFAPQA